MIAVTTSREWVAVPPPDLSGLDQHPAELWLGTVVAVVTKPHWAAWVLVGFAKVAEVVPTELDIEQFSDEPAVVQLDRNGNAWYWPEGSAHAEESEPIDLPHASPGGLALRLEPIRCPGRCHQGRLLDPISRGGGVIGPCTFCDRIGEPVTVVDLVGEIGRWER